MLLWSQANTRSYQTTIQALATQSMLLPATDSHVREVNPVSQHFTSATHLTAHQPLADSPPSLPPSPTPQLTSPRLAMRELCSRSESVSASPDEASSPPLLLTGFSCWWRRLRIPAISPLASSALLTHAGPPDISKSALRPPLRGSVL